MVPVTDVIWERHQANRYHIPVKVFFFREGEITLKYSFWLLGIFFIQEAHSYQRYHPVEYARYGFNYPQSQAMQLVMTASWGSPVSSEPSLQKKFITKATVYFDRLFVDHFVSENNPFYNLIIQDISDFKNHSRYQAAPLIICIYGSENRQWGLNESAPNSVPLSEVLEHNSDVSYRVYWNIVDHPPYSYIASHPLKHIGSLVSACPGETNDRTYKAFIQKAIEYMFKLLYRNATSNDKYWRNYDFDAIHIHPEISVTFLKTMPKVGYKNIPLQDSPPTFLRYRTTIVEYLRKGKGGLTKMEFVPVIYLLTDKQNRVTDASPSTLPIEAVYRARQKNPLLMYMVCHYGRAKFAYWYGLEPFDWQFSQHPSIRNQNITMKSHRVPKGSCPVRPGGPAREKGLK